MKWKWNNVEENVNKYLKKWNSKWNGEIIEINEMKNK